MLGKGQFLEHFFTRAGELGDPNTQGEYAVRCPFKHNKGYDQNPSAHVNLSKGVFHCKVCLAEERFGNGGLSEIEFISQFYGIPRRDAVLYLNRVSNVGGADAESWDSFEGLLLNSPKFMDILTNRRKLTIDTIKAARLGHGGDGIRYPVFIFGDLVDIRTYNPDNEPKMKGTKGSTTLMFPFDLWYADEQPTLLVGGENDALVGRQLGFNAVTFTGGEGSVPSAMFLNMFNGKTVYICYDMDDPGQKSMQSVAFRLKEVGATVFMLRLPLEGSKEDKDLSDFYRKADHDTVYADMVKLMHDAPQFSEIEYMEEKNRVYPLVDLWNATEGRYHGRRISSRVIMAGKYDMDTYIPSVVRFSCKDSEDLEHDAAKCPLHKQDKLWHLGDHSLHQFLHLAEMKEEELHDQLRFLNYARAKCVHMEILERSSIQKVILVPDVETENDLDGFRSVEQYGYVIDTRLNDGDKYRVFYKPFGHPHEDNRAYMVIDKVEKSDNALNMFQMNPQLHKQLSVFQGSPDMMMAMRYAMSKRITMRYTTEMIVHAVDLTYHSPIEFLWGGARVKGFPEIMIIGESRTGKTSAAKALQRFFKVGNITSLKNTSVAGLLGGADKLPSGGWKVKWGAVPRNHKGLLILDEASGITGEIMSKLTDMRSEGVATLTKISAAKAPAKTRLLWIGNPRTVGNRIKPLSTYPSGVDAVLDLVGSDEDVARFDAIMMVTDKGEYIKPEDYYESGADHFEQEAYVSLIRWIWSRTAEQIRFDNNVRDYIWSRAQVLNESYAADVKLLGAEADVKLARIAVACAACCFSTDEHGEDLIVQKSHVDWAEGFLHRCYDDEVFRLKEYVEKNRMYNTVTPEVEHVVHGLMSSDATSLIIKELLDSNEIIPQRSLQTLSGLKEDQFSRALVYLTRHHLIRNSAKGVMATPRLRKCARTFVDLRLKPLTERG